ncbi:hypothetical protein [Dactylosporangium sp. CA-139066]|uniref:hypothetical protein n=1 Tax=Dactylosporangium sp. CA-139066 TaxID=3239930 RepID=UPI003D8DFB14
MAPPPSTETIAAGLAALRDDATAWLSAAADLARAAAAPPPLDADEFGLAGEWSGLTAVHADLRRQVADRLAEGARTGTATAAALNEAADGYERDEQAAVHGLLGIW